MLVFMSDALRGDARSDVIRRFGIVALISFLTLIDLFGSQALLPQIIVAYDTNPGLAGIAVNAATFGMAIAGLTVAWFADRIDRRRGIWLCLTLLAIPTALLALSESIGVFLILRILQGMFMAAAFTLTMTYLSERCDVMALSGVMAAYITGNVASNLFGRFLAVTTNDVLGLPATFVVFAGLNLLGAGLAYVLIGARDTDPPVRSDSPIKAWRRHWADPNLRACFAIGFLILFIFVGLFTYVNLHLVTTFGLTGPSLGLVYLVFVPALFTTPFAGRAARSIGAQRTLILALGAALLGLALLLVSSLAVLLVALALVGASTFFAQAAATGFIGQHAKRDRAAANGLYLSSYYAGGMAGAALLGQLQLVGGWFSVVCGLLTATAIAMVLTLRLKDAT